MTDETCLYTLLFPHTSSPTNTKLLSAAKSVQFATLRSRRFSPLAPQSWRCNRAWGAGRCLPEAVWQIQSHRSWWSLGSPSHPCIGCYWASGLGAPPERSGEAKISGGGGPRILILCSHGWMHASAHPLAVEVVNSLGDGVEHSTGLSLREELLPEDLVQQLPSLH